jgi:hypothetical protein
LEGREDVKQGKTDKPELVMKFMKAKNKTA